jgi:hypothetical protein
VGIGNHGVDTATETHLLEVGMRVWSFVWLMIGISGCGGPAGDWTAVSVESDAGLSTATGILELDRSDGETLLELTLVGDGPEGVLDAMGTASRSGDTATLSLTGTWTDDAGATTVAVTGPCVAVGNDLTCELDVDGDAWTLSMARERG